MWPTLFLFITLSLCAWNWENRPAIQKAIIKPLEWTENLEVLRNQQTDIVQTLATIYNDLGTNEKKVSAIVSHYNHQTENFMPKLQPQITRFASMNSINEPGKLEIGRNCRENSTFKITINQNNKYNRYQLWQPATKLLLHQHRTKFNKNSTTGLLDIDMEGVATFASNNFHYELRNLQNLRPTTTTFSMNGPDPATELSVKKFQRHFCFLEKNMESNTPQNFPNSKQNQLGTRKYFKTHEATNLDDEKTELMHSNLERFSQELKFCLGSQRTESKKLSYKSNQQTNSTNQQSNQKICMLSTTITGQMTNRANLCSLINQPANPTQGDFVTNYFKEKSASPLTSHCTDQFEQITNLSHNDRTTQYEDQMADHLENSPTKKDIISTKSHLSAATSVFNQVYPSSSTVN
jgi:hypothetical protein